MTKYEISRANASFLNYITKIIRYKSIKLKIKYQKLYNLEELSLNVIYEEQEKINLIADEASNIEDSILCKKLQGFNEIIENKKLIQSIEKLTEKQRYIIYELYVSQTSERELAKKLNISFQYINKAKKTALKKLNESLLNTNTDLKN